MIPERRLIVLAPSHFCERARWALDHNGIAYREERWAPLLHVPLARRIAGGTALPILCADGEVIQGSDRILDWTGMAEADQELEERFEKRIGPLVRRMIYAGVLGERSSGIRDILLEGVPFAQAVIGRAIWPMTRRLMVTTMKVEASRLQQLAERLSAELDWFDGMAAKGRYLVGDRFGRADITAASLLAPLARPASLPLYSRLKPSPHLNDILAQWNTRPSLHWVRDIYAKHRGRVV